MDFCNRHLSQKALMQAFLLTYDRVRRYEGAWHSESRLMFPAYVLLESENEKCLIKELRECGKIEEYERGLVRMNSEEEGFLKGLYGDRHHLKMSRGILFKGAARITEGPLKGMEKRICKIDRHKRLAHVRTLIEQDGRCIPWEAEEAAEKSDHNSVGKTKNENMRYVPVGLEITEKIK